MNNHTFLLQEIYVLNTFAFIRVSLSCHQPLTKLDIQSIFRVIFIQLRGMKEKEIPIKEISSTLLNYSLLKQSLELVLTV